MKWKKYPHQLANAWRTVKKWPFWQWYSTLEWILLFIGVVTSLYLLMNFFTKLGDRDLPPHTTTPLSFEKMGEFQNTLATAINSSVEPGSPITILTDGAEFLPDFLAEIENAERSISISNFIWIDGEFGNTLLDALTKKAKEGVEVRILVDALGSAGISEEHLQKLVDAGGKFAYFRPLNWWNMDRFMKRNHIRDIVIDGKV